MYDNVFAGWNQPIIGNFVINIGELMVSLADERKRELYALKTMVETLKKVARREVTSSFLAKSMRSMARAKMEQEGASADAIAAFSDPKSKK